MARRKEPSIPDTLLDQLLSGADPKTAFDPGGPLDGLKKALAEGDRLCPLDRHLLMHSLIADSELVVLKGAGHILTLESPNETNTALSRWLEPS